MARSKRAQAAIDDALRLSFPTDSVGLGVDLVEISRMRKVMERCSSFAERVFSAEERAYCDAHPDPIPHYAARFAAKEAILKALGTGFSYGIGMRDVEVVRDKNGRPRARLYRRALDISIAMEVEDIPISISHTAKDAIACAIAITKGSHLAQEKRASSNEELASRFKETRGWLDEIGSPALLDEPSEERSMVSKVVDGEPA